MLHHQASMTMAPPLPLEPEPSDYDWIGDLGEGGFARVSMVRHRRTGKVFALKEAFYPSPTACEEAEVLRRAASYAPPYVVRCHAVFLDHDGGLSSVLELMDAGSLLSVLCRRGDCGFPEPALAEVAARCLKGLVQLLSHGVTHLDVKPENFLANSQGEVKISDFNASRIVYDSAGEGFWVPTTMGAPPATSAPSGSSPTRTPSRAEPWPPTSGESASPSSSCSWGGCPSIQKWSSQEERTGRRRVCAADRSRSAPVTIATSGT
jgi:mitogen-activated protein kinase kinase 9